MPTPSSSPRSGRGCWVDPAFSAPNCDPERYPHAEERRLFYVALTRARRAVYLLADHGQPSGFLTEIQGYGEDLVAADGFSALAPVTCPGCRGGVLVQRTGKHGVFYGCSNYPLCDHTARTCQRCGVGLMRPESGRVVACDNEECGHQERICPGCGTGFLVERKGQYGRFLGCTNYASGGCWYTEKLSFSV